MTLAQHMRFSRWISTGAAMIVLLVLSVIAVEAQTVPTTAPTKTPTAVPADAESLTATPPPTLSIAPAELPLTQADLNRLTANVQRPNGFYWFNDLLYTACTGDSTVYEINSVTGQTSAYIFGIQNAHTMYVEEDANNVLTMWVPDYEANTVSMVTRSGVRPIVRDLQGPWGLAYLDEEQFLVTNLHGNTLNLINRDGDNTAVIDDLAAPAGIVIDDEASMVYLANTGSTRRAIEWYPLDELVDGSYERSDAASQTLVSGLQNVTGVQLGPDGYLYFAYALGTRGVIGRVRPAECTDGGCTNEQVEIVLYSDLSAPLAGLTITPDSRLFVHEMFSPDLYWMQLAS